MTGRITRIAARAVRRWQSAPELIGMAVTLVTACMILLGALAWQDHTATGRNLALAGFAAGGVTGVVLAVTVITAVISGHRGK